MHINFQFCVLLSFLLISSCIKNEKEEDNDLSNLEYSITLGYPNAEIILPPNSENIYLGYSGTPYVLNLKFGATDSNTVYLSQCTLFEFNDSINVDEWIIYHHYDATTNYSGIGPEFKYSAQYEVEINLKNFKVDTLINKETFIFYATTYKFDVVIKNIEFENCKKYHSILELNEMVLYTDEETVFLFN